MTDEQRKVLMKRLRGLLKQIKAEGPVDYLMADYSHTHKTLMENTDQ